MLDPKAKFEQSKHAPPEIPIAKSSLKKKKSPSRQHSASILQTPLSAIEIEDDDTSARRRPFEEPRDPRAHHDLKPGSFADFSILSDQEAELLAFLALKTESAVIVADAQGRVEWVNDGFLRLSEYTPEYVRGKSPASLLEGPTTDPATVETLRQRIRTGEPFKGEIRNRSQSGRDYWILLEIQPIRAEGKITHFLGLGVEITSWKNRESELKESEEKYAMAVLCANDGHWNWNITKNEIYISPRLKELLLISNPSDQKEFDNFLWRLHPDDHDRVMKGIQDHLERRGPYNCEYRLRVDTGEYRWFQARGQAFWDAAGQPIRMAGAISDVTERKRSEEEIVGLNIRLSQRLERLAVLQNIDRAVAASLDLRLTLQIILEQTIQHLHAQAGTLWIHSKYSNSLEVYVERGFRFKGIPRAPITLGKGQAGRAALERRTLYTDQSPPDVNGDPSPSSLAEGFVSSCSVPLMAKGELKGVLELYYLTPTQFDHDATDFLETVAGQAAVAVDDARLFESLQRSNMDLTLAYDATIEGWSRALDLRDKETEGHSRRVTELTVNLARRMKVAEVEIVDIRRGALLHDIGKMGVPDAILQKPGPLNDEELEIMRRHPRYALDMLSPIKFLRQALDIPYCHHEKWDGTGYPRGLKGDQIPISARIFAVVDVWDAIRSDRPYRKAWTVERSLRQIQSSGGNHFDPKVVEVFSDYVREQQAETRSFLELSLGT